MSWNGEGFDKPLIYKEFETVQETIEKNAFRPDEDVETIIRADMPVEELIKSLALKEMLKETCDFMAFSMNRRVGVWWAYNCVRMVKKEIEEAHKKNPLPPEEQLKADIDGKVKEWSDQSEMDAVKKQYEQKAAAVNAKFDAISGKEIKDLDHPLKPVQDYFKHLNNAEMNDAQSAVKQFEKAINAFPPAERAASQARIERMYKIYEKENGINPIEQIKQVVTSVLKPDPVPKDTALVDQYYGAIQSKIKDIDQYITKSLSQYFPLKISGLPKRPSQKKIDEALKAAKRWIFTPTDKNAALARDAGNPTLQSPEGLCALTAFWSGSNLFPESRQPVTPPPGLAAQGISKTVYLCAMQKGGSKSYDERYEEFFRLGVDCFTGLNTWDQAWKEKEKAADKQDVFKTRAGFGREFEDKEEQEGDEDNKD
ncbi:hypothetical protein P0136_12635 [Lentisphaerota bacterium ZTH]|nr:hypothetical protein JYG24_09850 [Lentisphaerota bacterium]WET06205.1 hypothetical protein P0136_12635 [Lentisphaerota bacterium ZTH]